MLTEHLDALLRNPTGVQEKEGLADVASGRLLRSLNYKIHSEEYHREKGTLHPSDAGKCALKVQYDSLGVQGEPTLPEAQFKFLMGDLLELAVVYMLGHVKSIRLWGNNVKFPILIGGKERRGATDGTVQYKKKGQWSERYNLEIKSMSKWGYQYAKKDGLDNTWGYLSQHEVYVRQRLKNKEIDPPGKTIFLLIDRDSMAMHEQVFEYTGEYASAADEKFIAIETANREKRLLPRPFELNDDGTLPLLCSYCPHKFSCWSSPRVIVTFNRQGKPIYPKNKKMKVKVERSFKKGKPIFAPIEV